MPKGKGVAITYPKVKEIILACKDKRTQALIAFQYAMGSRAGELAKEYKHIVQKKKKRLKKMVKVKDFISTGILRESFFQTEDSLDWECPNFKNKKRRVKRGYVMRKSEAWLYKILLAWLDDWKPTAKNDGKYLFDIKASRIKSLIDTELKQYNSTWFSHCLRHSRATHIGEVTMDIFSVQDILGHGRMETSRAYVSMSKQVLKDRLGSKSFESVLGKKV